MICLSPPLRMGELFLPFVCANSAAVSTRAQALVLPSILLEAVPGVQLLEGKVSLGFATAAAPSSITTRNARGLLP